MSQTLDQIFIANPSGSMTSTDILYLVHSPYNVGTDSAITWANMQSSITHVGTITTGVWNGTLLSPTYGGTGVNNGANTFTIAGNTAFSGAHTFTGTLTNNTAVTFPTSGTLATTTQIPTGAALTETNDTNVTLTLGGSPTTALINAASITAGWTGTLSGARGGTGTVNTGQTINLSSFATGYVLTSDASGNAAWAANPGVGSVLLSPSGDQTITAHSLTIAQGNLTAGSSGHTGTVTSFPPTASKGSLVLQAVENTGNTTTTLSNAAMGQATTVSIPDPGASTSNICQTTTPLTVGNLVSTSGANGILIDSGISAMSHTWTVNPIAITNVTVDPWVIHFVNAGVSQVAFDLPIGGSAGDTYIIIGNSAGGWSISTSGAQTLRISGTAASSLTSTNQYDCITLVNDGGGFVQNFICYAIQGNLTIV